MTQSTTTYSFGDVVLVAFPFTNLSARKKRPAVIISNHDYHQNRPDVILMAITSRVKEPLFTGESPLENWKDAGLPKISILKPLIATLEQKQIVSVLGKLSTTDRQKLIGVIQTILGES